VNEGDEGVGTERGVLYVVATPIGNLDDITLRALEVLRSADVLACEDTRHTRKLLDRHGIEACTRSYHKFNEKRRSAEILDLLAAGKSVALVADAGTPAISDPGAEVVGQAGAAGFRVVPIPGPSALTALLSVSGLPAARHLFVGYPPHRAGERRRWLEELSTREECLVLLEAPTRIAATLADLSELLGSGRRAVVGRELTKMHEEILRGTLGELVERFQGRGGRGEFTVMVRGAESPAATLPEGTIADQVRLAQERLGLDRKEAMSYVARERGISRREVYASLLAEKGGEG
jgi:16S rRNA (cytidine1402-2'-O)-methyltransferase